MATCQECSECPPVPPLIPVCEDPEFCSEIIYARCVIYNGPNLPNLGVITGENLNSVLLKINNLLAPTP